MTADEVKTALGKAARRCWPDVTKASDLPFPEYWKAVTEWLTFHAPRVGDALMWKFIDGFAVAAKEAEESGQKPVAPKIPDAVRAIWDGAAKRGEAVRPGGSKADEKKDAWEHAAERAAATREFFAARSRASRWRIRP